MRKIILFLGFLCAGHTAISQTTLISPVPANSQGITDLRLPNGTSAHTSIRGHYLLRASEIPLLSGSQITGLGFAYVRGTNALASGNFIVYLQNTADNSNTKSMTWATAISTMTEVYNGTYTLPQTDSTNVDFVLQTPFTYTGGAIYVAYEYIGSSFATVSATNVAQNECIGPYQKR